LKELFLDLVYLFFFRYLLNLLTIINFIKDDNGVLYETLDGFWDVTAGGMPNDIFIFLTQELGLTYIQTNGDIDLQNIPDLNIATINHL
jgi:hypothetical protein